MIEVKRRWCCLEEELGLRGGGEEYQHKKANPAPIVDLWNFLVVPELEKY